LEAKVVNLNFIDIPLQSLDFLDPFAFSQTVQNGKGCSKPDIHPSITASKKDGIIAVLLSASIIHS
jgi:hypothetical protein